MKKSFMLILGIIFLLNMSLGSAVLNDSVIYWSFDDADITGGDDQTDLSGNNNTGIAQNTPTTGATGILRQAYDMERDNSEYMTPTSDPSLGIADTYTVSLWFNAETVSQNSWLWMFRSGTNDRVGLHFQGGNTFTMDTYDGSFFSKSTDVPFSSTGSWHHALITSSGTDTIDFWLDGVEQSGTTGSDTPGSDGMAFAAVDGGTNTYDGLLDEVAVYTRKLSAGEIATLFNGGVGFNPYFVPPPSTANNFSTEQSFVNTFTNEIDITALTFSPVNIVNFTVENKTLSYFSASLDLTKNGGAASTLGECEIRISNNTIDDAFNSTKQITLTKDFINNFIAMTVNVSLSAGDYNATTFCRRVSGQTFTVINTAMAGHEMIDGTTGQLINYEFYNASNITLVSAFTFLLPDLGQGGVNFTTTNVNLTNTTNERVLVIEWEAEYTYATAGNLSSVIQIDNLNCSFYPRFGEAGTTGSLGGSCLARGLPQNTNITIQAFAAGDGVVDFIKVHAKELHLNRSAINSTGLNGSSVNSTILVHVINITLSNVLGGTFSVFAQATPIVSDSGTTANFQIRLDTIEGINHSRSLDGSGEPGASSFQEGFSVTGTSEFTVSLWSSCTLGTCNFVGGDLIAYITGAEAVSDNVFTITAFDNLTGLTLNSFNVTIGGATFITNNGSLLALGLTNPSTVLVQSSVFFSNTTSHDTSIDLNASMIGWTNITAFDGLTGSLVSNFTLTITGLTDGLSDTLSTSNGTILAPLFNQSYTVKLFDGTNGTEDYANATVNTSANPYRQQITFTLFRKNSVNFRFFNINTLELINTTQVFVELLGSTLSRNDSTLNGTLLIQDLNSDLYRTTASAAGFSSQTIFVTVNEDFQIVNMFLDTSTQNITLFVRSSIGREITDATISISTIVNGTVIVIAQETTDLSAIAVFPLDVNKVYTVSVTHPEFTTFIGTLSSSLITQNEFTIIMQLPGTSTFTSVFSQVELSRSVSFVNTSSAGAGNFSILMDIISSTGLLQSFGVSTIYLGVPFISEVSGIPGGGTINLSVLGDLSLQNCVNVSYFFNATGFPAFNETSQACFQGYDARNVTFTTGLFDDIDLGTSGKGVIATIILIIAMGGMLVATRQLKGTVLVGAALIGGFGFVGMYPFTISILVAISIVVLVVAGEVLS